ncbi:uncharacterized protein LOC143355391 [Halictus rubicundus]|uniref:uncharacterized protein LOC143355391 n=1 Tax=Halictus rubicundus TaxID=77578 RepID=UPI0040366CB6
MVTKRSSWRGGPLTAPGPVGACGTQVGPARSAGANGARGAATPVIARHPWLHNSNKRRGQSEEGRKNPEAIGRIYGSLDPQSQFASERARKNKFRETTSQSWTTLN